MWWRNNPSKNLKNIVRCAMSLNNFFKIRICQSYKFNNHSHLDYFIIDFKEKNAYWHPENFRHFEDIESSFKECYGCNIAEYEGNDLLSSIYNHISKEKIPLNTQDIKNFRRFIDESDFFNQLLEYELEVSDESKVPDEIMESFSILKSKNRDKLHRISLAYACYITFYYETFKITFICNFHFPETWADFAFALENLIGFDLLNINISKNWINNINYNLRKTGVFDKENDEKLILEKFIFHYHSHLLINEVPNFYICFDEKLLVVDENIEELNQNILNNFENLLVKHDVYLWSSEESYTEVLNYHTGTICDGYRWSIKLIFNNGSVFYVGLHCEHPDSYFEFAKDVKSLFGKDLLAGDNFSSKQSKLYNY